MLEVWQAEWLEGEIGAGRTRPLSIMCSRSSPGGGRERRPMVVKAMGLPEITTSKLFNEAFGNLLAQEVGVATPAPHLVEISPGFLDANQASLSARGQRPEAGLAVGTEQLAGLMPLPPGVQLGPGELVQATLIYGFDHLVQDPDRRVKNPNCGRHGDRLVVYDFEMSFSFILTILAEEEPWEVSKHRRNDEHLFRPALRRAAKVNWRPLIRSLESLTEERMVRFCQGLPDDWKRNWGRILRHIQAVQSHLAEFELELQWSLA